MPWNHADPVTERLRFVALVKEGNFGKKELCDRFGVSRQTGDDTLERYEEKGIDGLKDGGHAPHTCPHRISDEMREVLLQRGRHIRIGGHGRSSTGCACSARSSRHRPPARWVTCTAARSW